MHSERQLESDWKRIGKRDMGKSMREKLHSLTYCFFSVSCSFSLSFSLSFILSLTLFLSNTYARYTTRLNEWVFQWFHFSYIKSFCLICFRVLRQNTAQWTDSHYWHSNIGTQQAWKDKKWWKYEELKWKGNNMI